MPTTCLPTVQAAHLQWTNLGSLYKFDILGTLYSEGDRSRGAQVNMFEQV